MAKLNDTVETSITKSEKLKEKIYATVFLSTVASISALAGFTRAVAATRKQDPKHFGDGISGMKGIPETGASLAIRALGWGTLYAVTGCGLFFYGIWKLSGATNTEEFRFKMGSLLPKIPKNDPPQSRTKFEGLTDLLTYISEDWGRNKEHNILQK
ncbi:PREDICTED: transmembrane protein 242 [Atta colombica]|uniref:transmembrane protein 242 n=1 Tax=Atta colombica TaxID=520822 RepID=UPI00084C9D54|nr:PREDICTED: transmembrane protein 242 [Atta colombica]